MRVHRQAISNSSSLLKGMVTNLLGGLANALNPPPEEYGRKARTQRNRRGPIQVVEHVV